MAKRLPTVDRWFTEKLAEKVAYRKEEGCRSCGDGCAALGVAQLRGLSEESCSFTADSWQIW